MASQEIQGKPTKRFTVRWGTDSWKFDTAAEVIEFTNKRLDRSYEIYDHRNLVKKTDLKDRTEGTVSGPSVAQAQIFASPALRPKPENFGSARRRFASIRLRLLQDRRGLSNPCCRHA